MGIGDNEVSQSGNGGGELGDDDRDQGAADRQADAGHDERQCRRQDQISPQSVFRRTKRVRHLD
jgi:hypothetical protein